ncbi:MAG: RNA polymerase sigma factor [Chitinophagales bacterium]
MKKNLSSLSDSELTLLYYESSTINQDIIGILYERYKVIVFKYCIQWNYKYKNGRLSRAEIEDIVSDIFMKIMDKMRRTLVTTNFKSWLITVSRNYFIDYLRKHKKQDFFAIIDDKDANTFVENSDIHVIIDDKALNVEATPNRKNIKHLIEVLDIDAPELWKLAISKLKNEQQHQCASLFYLGRYRFKQIAHETGLDIKKVKGYLGNAKRNLRIILTKELKQIHHEQKNK